MSNPQFTKFTLFGFEMISDSNQPEGRIVMNPKTMSEVVKQLEEKLLFGKITN